MSEHRSSGTSRRDFLKTATSATVAASLGFFTAGRGQAGGREDAPPVRIGRGDLVYTLDHHWAKLPEGKQFGYTHGVVEDRQGRIYIANQSKDAIMVFDADGRFLTSWGEAYEKGAHGLEIAREGDREVLYLANTGLAEVVKTTLDGEVLWRAGAPDLKGVYSEEKKYSPTETAVAPDGTVYVADGYGQSWIHVYSADGEYLRSFGGPGDGEANLNGPHGIHIDLRGGEPVVQVSDRNNVRVVNFDLDGAFMGVAIPRSELRFPCTTEHRGDLLYVPDLFSRISIFDGDNRKIVDVGDYVDGQTLDEWSDFGATYPDLEGYPNIPHEKRLPNKFISPHGLLVDHRGDLFVVEWVSDGRVTKLTAVR